MPMGEFRGFWPFGGPQSQSKTWKPACEDSHTSGGQYLQLRVGFWIARFEPVVFRPLVRKICTTSHAL
eukprot:2335041-Lingulodinium_polyedra.AAC.1